MKTLAICLVAISTSCSAGHEPIPEDAPLPGDLLEIDLTDEQSEALCDWWMDRHGGEGYIYQCPPPPTSPTEVDFSGGITCGTVRRADFPDCPVTVQDWYNCELSQPYWWCVRPTLEVCLRPESCGMTFYFP